MPSWDNPVLRQTRKFEACFKNREPVVRGIWFPQGFLGSNPSDGAQSSLN